MPKFARPSKQAAYPTAIYPSALLLVALLLVFSVPTAAESFTFVQLCDTQLGMGGYDHDQETFKLAVRHINRLKPDFVVVCGDLIDTTEDDKALDDFNSIKEGFTVPVYCAPGNHDVGNEPSLELLERFRKVIGPDYFVFEREGYAFIVVNTSLWKSPLAPETEKQNEWFEKVLSDASRKNQRAFVFGHYPPFTKNPKESESYFNLPMERRKEILSLLKKHKAIGFLAGHVHRNAVADYKGMFIVASASTSRNFDGSPMGFRLWTVHSPKDVTHEYIAVEGASPPED